MKTIKAFIIALFLAPIISFSQSDCASFLKYQALSRDYDYNSLSKSAKCISGKKYKLVVPLNKGKEYRMSFHASSSFNNEIDFKILDQNTKETILYLPGAKVETTFDDQYEYDEDGNLIEKEKPKEENNYFAKFSKFKSVLKPEFDESEVLRYPFFIFIPENSMNLEVMIEVHDAEGAPIRGCIGMLIQDKESEEIGF